jgi:nucleoside-diphosphate-sugar epimerase
MRILVIGGTRFIGPPVLRRLHAGGHELLLVHRGQTHADLPAGIKHLTTDRQHLSAHATAMMAFAPEIVLDMIPSRESDAQAVMDLFHGVARRVVAISSQDVYHAFGLINGTESGPPDPLPLDEDAPLRRNLYPFRGVIPEREEYDKILVERVVMCDATLPGTVLRLPAVYGPGDYQHRVAEYLRRMDDGRRTIILASEAAGWRWTRGYSENVADAIALAVTDDRATNQIFNVGEPAALSLGDWVRAIGAAAGWHGAIAEIPNAQLPPDLQSGLNTQQEIVIDSTRIRRELGYHETVDREVAFAATVAWERANPPATDGQAHFDYVAEDAVLAQWRDHSA